MKLDRLNQWLVLVANTGVFVGLIFLIVELDQANRIATADAESALRDKSIETWSWTITQPEFSSLLVKLRQPDPDLTPEEQEQAYAWAGTRVNVWATAQANHNNGILSDTTFERYAVDTEFQLDRYPGSMPYYINFVESREGLLDAPIFLRLLRALEKRGYQP